MNGIHIITRIGPLKKKKMQGPRITPRDGLDSTVYGRALAMPRIRRFLAQPSKDVQINQLTIHSAFPPEKPLFVTGVLDATSKNHQNPLPGFVLFSDDATSVLLVDNDREVIICVSQDRVAPQQRTVEAVAGILDDDGDVQGQSIKEVKEETGVLLTPDMIKPFAGPGIYSSMGRTTEFVHFRFAEVQIPEQNFKSMLEKQHGDSPLEVIRVVLLPLHDEEAALLTMDPKLIIMRYMYLSLKGCTFCPLK